MYPYERTDFVHLKALSSHVRLDRYIADRFPDLSRAQIQNLIKAHKIRVNNCRTKPSYVLRLNDLIDIEIDYANKIEAQPIQLNIVYEDEDVIVVNKPAGLVVHPGPGHPDRTLVNAILYHCPELSNSSELLRPGIVHRLDKDTSGLIIIVKHERAREYLVQQFKNRTVNKKYLVLVKGCISPQEGAIEAPIGRNPKSYKHMVILKDGKNALTYYRVRKYYQDSSLLDVTLKTGRTHQIRVHFSAINYPVMGDTTYGYNSQLLKRQFIHAYCIGFLLPSTEIYKEFHCPLPDDLSHVLKKI